MMNISNIHKMPKKEWARRAMEADVVQSTENSSPIDKLINYCLEEIFMYLSPEERLKNELVCKKWRSINRLILKRIKKLDFHYVEPDWEYIWKTRGVSFFWTESLLEFKQRFNYVPRLLQLTGKYLRELDLSALTNTIILTKLKRISFPQLIKLKLRLYMWNYKHNDYRERKAWELKHCDNVFNKMTKLESLHLTVDCRENIPKNFIIAMLPLANTLKELSVINNTYHMYSEEKGVSHAFWSRKTREFYLPMLTEFKSLRFLELKSFRLSLEDCKALRHLNLKKLVIARCFFIRQAVKRLNHLLDNESLEEFALGICDENIDDFLKKIPNNLKSLTKLILFQPNATAHIINVISSVKRFQTIVVNDRKELNKIIYT